MIFYFSGHGFEIEGETFLMPTIGDNPFKTVKDAQLVGVRLEPLRQLISDCSAALYLSWTHIFLRSIVNFQDRLGTGHPRYSADKGKIANSGEKRATGHHDPHRLPKMVLRNLWLRSLVDTQERITTRFPVGMAVAPGGLNQLLDLGLGEVLARA